MFHTSTCFYKCTLTIAIHHNLSPTPPSVPHPASHLISSHLLLLLILITLVISAAHICIGVEPFTGKL